MVSEHRRAVGIFPDRPRTASALQALHDSGFSMSNVSVIAKDADKQNAIAGIDVRDEVTNQSDKGGAVGAVTGGILGGVTGLLVGLGTLTIPGIGPALLAGEAAAVMTTLIGGAAGAAVGGLAGALIGLGIPEHRAKHYQDRVARGDYLVMLKETDPELARAEQTLKASGIEDWGIYPTLDDRATPDRAPNGHRAITHESHDQRVDTRLDSDHDRRDRFVESDRVVHSGLPHSSNPITPAPTEHNREPNDARYTSATMTEERRVIGVFRDRAEMESALEALKQTGFPMHRLSIAVRETNGGHFNRSEGHSLTGAASLTSGLNHLDLPGVGSTSVIGPDADAISGVARHHRSSGLAGILESLGIAHEAASMYGRHLADGAYLVTLRGRNEELMRAASALGNHGMHDWGIYDVRPT